MCTSPWFEHQYLHLQPEREYLVFVVGVGTTKRQMQAKERTKLCEWLECVLLVMIADEDQQGLHRSLAIGAMYPDLWAKAQPKWTTVVVG